MNNKINWDVDVFDDIDGLKEYIKEYLEKDTIRFAGEEGVRIPTKRDEDGGYDIYAFFEDDFIEIKPHETKIIPTGLYSAFSNDYVAILHERGSNGVKGIGQRSGVIDSGYRGEWGVPLTNHNDKTLLISKFTYEELINCYNENVQSWSELTINTAIKRLNNMIIYPYSKAICQAIFLSVPKLKTRTISIEELQAIPSVRGEGKLGSSNK
ncbi:MAG: dUTP pyrophosphatase [Terrisporobacter othiniensis]|nr:dUTP pyrophosphatase [Terrisporobacter othiniensis]